jgi:hypothetical protein
MFKEKKINITWDDRGRAMYHIFTKRLMTNSLDERPWNINVNVI